MTNTCCPCYEQIMNPSFFGRDGDCDSTNHDIQVSEGDLQSGNETISAVLIQLGTDSRSNGERGWWGDEFASFPIGTALWSLRQGGITALKADELIRAGIDPLIEQGLVDDLRVDATRTIDGVEVDVDLFRNNQSIFTAIL